jgi:transcriptional regulator with XRE-family HTH domain
MMTISARDVATTDKAWRQAKREFRKAFGDVARAYRKANGLTAKAVSDKAFEFARQANVTGVYNFERGRPGWVDPKFAEGVFRAVGIPDAELLGSAYRDLKILFHGETKETN